MLHEKNVKLFTAHKVYSEAEIRAHYEIKNEKYCKYLNIEVLTMIDMAKKRIYPAITKYTKKILEVANLKKQNGISCDTEISLAKRLSSLSDSVYMEAENLEELIEKCNKTIDYKENAFFIKDEVLTCMKKLRASADKAETLTNEAYWPYPSYGKLLFSAK